MKAIYYFRRLAQSEKTPVERLVNNGDFLTTKNLKCYFIVLFSKDYGFFRLDTYKRILEVSYGVKIIRIGAFKMSQHSRIQSNYYDQQFHHSKLDCKDVGF